MSNEHRPAWASDLEQIRVAKACPASWRRISGDDRARHCTHCKRSVYNLSNMTRFEVQQLMLREEGRVCVRYFVREDGGVMTKDCPKQTQRLARRRGLFAAALSLFGLGFILSPVVVQGAVASPKVQVHSLERQLKEEKEFLSRSSDPEERTYFKQRIQTLRTRLRQALIRMRRED